MLIEVDGLGPRDPEPIAPAAPTIRLPVLNPTAVPKASPDVGIGSCTAEIARPKVGLAGLASNKYAAPASLVPRVAPGAPINAVFCVPATDVPKLPPPPSGWRNSVIVLFDVL